jgi:hypothetical protein
LFVGAGTGQMFDFAPPSFLLPFQTTFTDINPEDLQRLAERLGGVEGLRHTEVVDDLEESRLTGGFKVVLGVLVLEHVVWRRAVATMCGLALERAFVVIQQNPSESNHRPHAQPSHRRHDERVPRLRSRAHLAVGGRS